MKSLSQNLPPVESSVYNYLSQHREVEYVKEKLLVVIGLSSKTALTRGINGLIKKSLVTTSIDDGKTFLKIKALPSEGNEKAESAKAEATKQPTLFDDGGGTRLVLPKQKKSVVVFEEEAIGFTPVDSVVLPKKTVEVEEMIDRMNPKEEPTTEVGETTSLVSEVSITENITLKVPASNLPAINKPSKKEKAEALKKEILVNQEALKQVTSRLANLNAIGFTKEEFMTTFKNKERINEVLIARGLSVEQYQLLFCLYIYYLKNGKWLENNATLLSSHTGLSKTKVDSHRKQLMRSGKIKARILSETNKQYFITLTPSGVQDVKDFFRLNKDELMGVTRIERNELFNRRIYLIDTENIGVKIQKGILDQLTEQDKLLLCLSDTSSKERLSAQELHWMLESKCEIKSILVSTERKGGNDLDHVLVTELVLLVNEIPNAQFVILSNDKGYLAAINHLMKRLNLKEEQILLKPCF